MTENTQDLPSINLHNAEEHDLFLKKRDARVIMGRLVKLARRLKATWYVIDEDKNRFVLTVSKERWRRPT